MSDTSETEPETLQEQPSTPQPDERRVEDQPSQSDDPAFIDDEGSASWSVTPEQPDDAQMEALRTKLSSVS